MWITGVIRDIFGPYLLTYIYILGRKLIIMKPITQHLKKKARKELMGMGKWMINKYCTTNYDKNITHCLHLNCWLKSFDTKATKKSF